jgi:hypothetical protein
LFKRLFAGNFSANATAGNDTSRQQTAFVDAYLEARKTKLKDVRHDEGGSTSNDKPYGDSRLDLNKANAKGGPFGDFRARDWGNWGSSFRGGARGQAPVDNSTRAAVDAGNRAGLRAAEAELDAEARLWGGGEPLERVRVPRAVLEACPRVLRKLLEHFGDRPKYKHEELIDSPEVAFQMISTNQSNLDEKLDGIRVRRQKFICLNDNMNHADRNNHASLRKLRDFYESLYPLPSSFELPPDRPNKVLYIDELTAEQRAVRHQHMLIGVALLMLCGCLCLCWLALRRNRSGGDQRRRREDDNRRFLRI